MRVYLSLCALECAKGFLCHLFQILNARGYIVFILYNDTKHIAPWNVKLAHEAEIIVLIHFIMTELRTL